MKMNRAGARDGKTARLASIRPIMLKWWPHKPMDSEQSPLEWCRQAGRFTIIIDIHSNLFYLVLFDHDIHILLMRKEGVFF